MGNCVGVAGHNLGGRHNRPLSEKANAGDEDEQQIYPSQPRGIPKSQRYGTKLFLNNRRNMRPMFFYYY